MADSDQSQIENQNDQVPETEEVLIERARGALSNCNWVIGECATQWTEKYAKGRTDADFGNQIGLSADQIFQRRRVWETFNDVRSEYENLKWSHFYVSLNWDDSAECLSWAVENQATVAQMRAWRRSVHGEDLTEQPDPLAMQALDFSPEMVRDAEGNAASGVPFESTDSGELVGASSGESSPYSPYRKDARGPGSTDGSAEEPASTAVAAPPSMTPQRVVKRALGGMHRIQQLLEELTDEDYNELTPEIINQLWDAHEELGRSIKRQA
ncbi:MAG: hypothetical protein JKY95_18135 [Planctomycetaceae bacterium]|nr:hypothetical protein [Planctomycetaceae bacterium]MBL4886434.1 hypothetical protein [Planctomycetaceae bacterium]